MDLALFGGEEAAMHLVHPALDVVGDTLYVTVELPMGGRRHDVVLTSDGDALDAAEWTAHCRERNLVPLATASPRRSGGRWSATSARALVAGLRDGGAEAEAPTWVDAFRALQRALDAHLVVHDDRYLTLLALHGMMTYFHPLFDFLPILHLRGPAESGKSRAGAAIERVAFNGMLAGAPTASTLFRTAHEGRHTQIIAEGDHLARLSSGSALARQLQSACTKAEARVDLSEAGSRQGPTPPPCSTPSAHG